jgi:hypothetical protein
MSLKNSGGNGYMTTFDLFKSQQAGIALALDPVRDFMQS